MDIEDEAEVVAVATEDEAGAFVEDLPRTDTVLGRPVYGDSPRVVVTGVGRSNAASSVAVAVERYDVDRVVSTGVAGALPGSTLDVGDTFVGEHVVHADLGVETSEGFGSVEHLGFETTEGFYDSYPLDPLDVDSVSGGIATVSTVSATDEAAEEVRRRTECEVETMETAAVAQTATQADVAVSAVVGVSNHAGEDREFDFRAGQRAVEEALEEVYR